MLLSDLKEAPAITCQRNNLVSQGHVTYFETQGDKGHKMCLRLNFSFPQGSDIYNSSFFYLNEVDKLKKNPDYSSFHPDEIDALRGFYRPVDTTVPHDQIMYVKETPLGEEPWRIYRPTPPNSTEWNKHITDRYQKRTEQNWFISNKRMSQELRYSPDFPRVHKEPINCGNHAAPQCRDCTEGQIWE